MKKPDYPLNRIGDLSLGLFSPIFSYQRSSKLYFLPSLLFLRRPSFSYSTSLSLVHQKFWRRLHQWQIPNSFLLILFLSCSLIGNAVLFAQTFTDVAQSAGIEHTFAAYVDIGGGAAFFDYDMDGDEDVYFTGGRLMDKLYRNDGDGTFTDVTIESGLEITSTYYTSGVTTGDIDNDGFREIFVTTFGFANSYSPNKRNLLFRNLGDGTFQEMAPLANIGDASRSTGAIFFDHDLDGYLDLYVLNYINRTRLITNGSGVIGFDHDCYENYFYHNNGDFTFTEAAFELGINDNGCSLAGTNTDFDFDSDQDLYVVNDFGEFVEPNLMYTNQLTTGVFDSITGQTNGSGIGLYGMGIAWGDYDLDQDIDYYITNLGSNVLLNNNGAGQYQDVATAAGVTNTNTPDGLLSTSWGTAFIDFDNNLYEDLFVSNGYIPAADFIATGSLDPNKLFYNNGDQTFTDISDIAGFNSTEKCRGLAYGDYDNDGDVDLLVSSMYGIVDMPKVKLYRNDLDNSNNWVKIKLEGTQCNRDAIGAQIRLFIGDLVLIREISGGGSHASQHSSIAHFGLADYPTIDSIQVRWPGSTPETFFDLAINEQHHLVQGESPTVRISFSVDMSFQDVNPEGVYIRITSTTGEVRQKLLYSPYQDNQYRVSFLQELGFSGSYTLLNGRCNDGNCQEDLSEENCDDLTIDFERLLAPILNDTTINLCFGICYGLPCQSTLDSFSVNFTVNTAPLGEDLETIFIRGLSPTGQDLPMADPEGDGTYELSLNLAEGFSAYYTFINGECSDESCAEDLSGQECADPFELNYRFLNPVFSDTVVNLCFASCDAGDCLVPIDSVDIQINLNTAAIDVSEEGVYLIECLFGSPGVNPLEDIDEDGVFSISLRVPEGFSSFYSFTNGLCLDLSCKEDLTGQDCGPPNANNNRWLPPVMQDTIINTCFAECIPDLDCTLPPTPTPVTFGFHDPLNEEIAIFLNGEFGLPENDFELTESSAGSGEWFVTLDLLPDTYYYRFGTGTPMDGTLEAFATGLADTCTLDLSGEHFRAITVEDIALELEPVCFELCYSCEVIIDNVTTLDLGTWTLQIHPNPASKQTLVSWKPDTGDHIQIRLINAVGQIVEHFELASEKKELLLSTNNLPAGIYWVILETEGIYLTQKLVIQ